MLKNVNTTLVLHPFAIVYRYNYTANHAGSGTLKTVSFEPQITKQEI